MRYVQVACFWLMKHLNRRSVIVIAMALLMLISMVIIYYEAVASTLDSIRDRRLFDFGDICAGALSTASSMLTMYTDALLPPLVLH